MTLRPKFWVGLSVALVALMGALIVGALRAGNVSLSGGAGAGWPVAFALLVVVVYAAGVVYSLRFLTEYEEEEAALPKCAEPLRAFADHLCTLGQIPADYARHIESVPAF